MIRCRLRILLAQRGLTQSKFSELSGLSLRSIRNYYSNKFKLIDREHMQIICKTLKCSPGELFVYEEDF
ncbi:helix-turn-helix transcriptional regulator [Clostridium perfringens]|nr:helix-turn-helix transcriptional regulator [Clostridium perfringens]